MDQPFPEHPLRRFRLDRDIKIETLASDAKVAKSTISRIERWEMSPSLGLVKTLVGLTGGHLSASDFFKHEAVK